MELQTWHLATNNDPASMPILLFNRETTSGPFCSNGRNRVTNNL